MIRLHNYSAAFFIFEYGFPMNDLLYKIALTQIEGIGDVHAKKLLAYCGSCEAVFREKKHKLMKIPGIGEFLAASVVRFREFDRVEKEIRFIQKHKIQALFFLDPNYPNRLKQCEDAPAMLYYKGNTNLNAAKIVSIVGTRKATDYGKQFCEELVEHLSAHTQLLVVSGLAYGIDICAHKAAMKHKVPTVGVLAHGLDTIYPAQHRNIAAKMTQQGGLLTDFISETIPYKQNFPKRNRIVAGIADATIVVEAGITGGALITAEIANSYSRDVFAVPGKVSDTYSLGCNKLIKTNKAALLESVKDIEYIMGWDLKPTKSKKPQKQLLLELSPEEEKIMFLLRDRGKQDIDALALGSNLAVGKLASLLLNLEFNGALRSLPGKVYEAV
jgi:DNA processing protein